MAHLIFFDELFSSSESSDSDDADIDCVHLFINDEEERCHCILCRPRIPRIQHFIEEVIDNYNDVYFQQNFR